MYNSNNGIYNSNNGMIGSLNNSDNENSQYESQSNENIIQYDMESQFPHHLPIHMQQFKHPYPKSPMVSDITGYFMPKHVIPHPHPSVYCRPQNNQIFPPLHNFNPLIRPVDNQLTVKRHPVPFIPQPIVKGYPIPIKGPHIPQPMIKSYMFNRPLRPMMPQPPLHMTKGPMPNIPTIIQCDPNIDMRMAHKPIESHKHSILYEKANQCSLIYSAVRNRNVLSFLGLESTNRQQLPNYDIFRPQQYELPYSEIKIDNLWKYIEAWRGNMFELNHTIANDGYKVAISPSTLNLLGSIIEMRLIDIITELVKIANGKVITIEHLRTCLQKNSLDIAISSVRKIEKLHAKIIGHY